MVAIHVTRVRFPADAYKRIYYSLADAGNYPNSALRFIRPLTHVSQQEATVLVHGCVLVRFMGLWCSGITSALHAEGPGFEPRRVQYYNV